MTKKDLPVFELTANEDVNSEYELQAISLVDKPAIKEMFVAFADEKVFLADMDRHIVSGPVLIPNQLIERYNENGNYYLTMNEQTIQQLAIKYLKKGYNNNVTVMHNQDIEVPNVSLFEMFIADKERGVQHLKGFEHLPNGTLYASFYVENDEVWNAVKDGTFKGFSIEGNFLAKKVELSEDEKLNQIKALLSENLDDQTMFEKINFILNGTI